MKTLRGTQQYLITWEANKEQREKARAKEQERVTEARNKALKDTYDTMARRHAVTYLESLSPDARAVISTEAKERVLQKTSSRIGLDTFIAIEERRIALEHQPVPSFQEWQHSQQ